MGCEVVNYIGVLQGRHYRRYYRQVFVLLTQYRADDTTPCVTDGAAAALRHTGYDI